MFRFVWTALILAGLAGPDCAQAQFGESLRGAGVLRDRGCTSCHAVLGRGGGSAADLTAERSGVFSPAQFAAELWNHAPRMWASMGSEGRERPALSTQDVRDVFAFLYAVRYFEPSGNIDRGRRAFAAKRCYECHPIVRVDGGSIGPAVPDWPSLADPVLFLEAMWNHGEAMQDESELDSLAWPMLTSRELADLLAYIYNLPDRPPRLGRVELGAPSAGMRLFDDLGCVRCHTILDTDPDLIPLSPAASGSYTITDLAVAMWNHQPVMREWAAATGMEIPRLERGQMGQLLSYLMAEGFLDRAGNEKRGARLFESRGCQSCHAEGERPLPARDWTAPDFVAAVWDHGPAMQEEMRARGRRWPSLSGADVADILAWLNVRR